MNRLRRGWQQLVDQLTRLAVHLGLASWPEDDTPGHDPNTDDNTDPPERDEHPVITRTPGWLGTAVLTIALTACSSSPPPAPPPAFTLPADMPPLVCADFEPPPVAKPEGKFTARRCTDPDGSIRWIAGFFQCADGRIWPVLTKEQPTGAPAEPTGPEFDQCLGRT